MTKIDKICTSRKHKFADFCQNRCFRSWILCFPNFHEKSWKTNFLVVNSVFSSCAQIVQNGQNLQKSAKICQNFCQNRCFRSVIPCFSKFSKKWQKTNFLVVNRPFFGGPKKVKKLSKFCENLLFFTKNDENRPLHSKNKFSYSSTNVKFM